jgi:hypothetical protein
VPSDGHSPCVEHARRDVYVVVCLYICTPLVLYVCACQHHFHVEGKKLSVSRAPKETKKIYVIHTSVRLPSIRSMFLHGRPWLRVFLWVRVYLTVPLYTHTLTVSHHYPRHSCESVCVYSQHLSAFLCLSCKGDQGNRCRSNIKPYIYLYQPKQSMSVVGVDLGYQNCVIAAAGKGGVDVLMNGSAKRLNP